MSSCRSAVAGAIVASVAGLFCPPAGAQAGAGILSIKTSREAAPPGAIAQVKVFITEPKPITSGRAGLSFASFSDIEGIALGETDAAGIAIVNGADIALTIVSPSGTYGMDGDYPVLTIAGRVALDAPIGQRVPATLDPAALRFIDPSGMLYEVEVNDGYLVAGGVLSVGDVVPGSATLPAGATVSVFGTGFTPATKVVFKETLLAGVRFVNEGQMDVILAEPTSMHGKPVRVRSDKATTTYFSYQRTRPFNRSGHPVLRHVVPLFPASTTLNATIGLASATAGIAVQNLEESSAFPVAELLDGTGAILASTVIEVPANQFVVREIAELFGIPGVTGGVVRLVSDTPVQIMGVDLEATGAASPRLPH